MMNNFTSVNNHDDSQTPEIKGTVLDRFKPLKDVFVDNFTRHHETGAAICVYHNGQLVVNLYGNNKHTSPWQANHRVSVMSCSKAMLAICIHKLAANRQIELDAPICRYWPEFAKHNKAHITIASVLNHSAGLPCHSTGKPHDIFDWQASISNLESAAPIFRTGQKLVYHALTYGHILGEVLRRVDGRVPSTYFDQEIAQPLEIDCALKRQENYPHRDIKPSPAFSHFGLQIMSRWLPYIPYWKYQYFRPCSEHYHPNSSAWHTSEIPAVSGHASALGLAKMYAFLANGGTLTGKTLLPPSQVKTMTQLSFAGQELATQKQWRMGAGMMLNSPGLCPMGPNLETFGHMGMGGSIGFADPKSQLAFAYVTESFHTPNKYDKSFCGKRQQNLIKGLYKSLL